MAMNQFKSMATSGSRGQESSRNVADLTEMLDPQEHREFRSGAGICQFLTEQRFDIASSTKEIMKKAAGPTTAAKTKMKRITRYLQKDVIDVYWISLGWESWTTSSMWPWMQTGLETQRQGAPRLVECSQSVRASKFDIGLWHRQQYRYPEPSQSQGDNERLHWSVVRETPAGTPDCTTVQNWSLDRQQQRQSHHAKLVSSRWTSWVRWRTWQICSQNTFQEQYSTSWQEWWITHYLMKKLKSFKSTRASIRNIGIRNWQQLRDCHCQCSTMERTNRWRMMFAASWTTRLTSRQPFWGGVLRWTSFNNHIYTDHRDLLSYVTVLWQCWENVGMTCTNREV